ncbi:hypothetical protein [Neptunitalea lumnitzerae]|uniref:Uncharacterized protein n=1 Tax=Neptunitalea lumnitzerae TaxID=2965509 RepID=A0ABQ5ML61_9FLAO|nr:hypothetical protein [Neptunitalea sp. Y10]GLB50036.1 hypothetical protein Y10_24040 [Neptunitalea sp. Y10]
MTKEEAFRILGVPSEADMETIRAKFSFWYTVCDEQCDLCLTEGMKHLHEVHLKQLEDAYKVLTDSEVISDMGALLSMGKGYIEEGDVIGREQRILPEEALAFFAAFPFDNEAVIEERFKFYTGELDTKIEATALEASKQPFRKEKERAELYFQVALNYVLAKVKKRILQKQEVAEKQLANKTVDATAIHEEVEPAKSVTESTVETKKDGYGKLILIGLVLIVGLLIVSYVLFSKEEKIINSNDIEVVTPDREEAPTSEPDREQMIASPSGTVNDTPEEVEVEIANEVPKPLSEFYADSIALLKLINTYKPTDFVLGTLNKSGFYISNKKSKVLYLLPFKSIASINENGQFISYKTKYFQIDSKQAFTSQDFVLKGMNSKDKSRLLALIKKYGVTVNEVPDRIEKIEENEGGGSSESTVKEEAVQPVQTPSEDEPVKDSLELKEELNTTPSETPVEVNPDKEEKVNEKQEPNEETEEVEEN